MHPIYNIDFSVTGSKQHRPLLPFLRDSSLTKTVRTGAARVSISDRSLAPRCALKKEPAERVDSDASEAAIIVEEVSVAAANTVTRLFACIRVRIALRRDQTTSSPFQQLLSTYTRIVLTFANPANTSIHPPIRREVRTTVHPASINTNQIIQTKALLAEHSSVTFNSISISTEPR